MVMVKIVGADIIIYAVAYYAFTVELYEHRSIRCPQHHQHDIVPDCFCVLCWVVVMQNGGGGFNAGVHRAP